MLHVFRNFFIIIMLLPLLSCSRDIEEKSSVRIDLGQLSSSAKAVSQSVQTQAVTPAWNSSLNPVVFSDINCYGVFVGGPENPLKKHSCENSTNSSTHFKFGPHTIFVSAGSNISLDVPSGQNRQITIVGLKAQNGACKAIDTITGQPDFSNLSAPHIIAQKFHNLPPGQVTLIMHANLDTSKYIDTCNFFEGTASPNAVLEISETDSFSFGTIENNTSISHNFTITNTGNFAATSLIANALTSPFDFLGGTYPGTGGNCTSSLAPGSNCTIALDFAPTVTSSYNDTLSIDYYNGISTQQVNRNIAGTSTELAILTISDGPTYDYGTQIVGTNFDKTFTITNSGLGQATSMNESGIAAPYIFVGGTYPGTSGTCGSTLNPSSNCTINVRYSPTVSGVNNDSIQINYFDGNIAQTSNRNITATAAIPALITVLEASPFDFGSIASLSSMTMVLNIQNTGGVTATSMSGVTLNAPYSYTSGPYPGTPGTCGPILTAGSTCTIYITFTPPSAAVFPDSFTINYNDGTMIQNTVHNITGTGL